RNSSSGPRPRRLVLERFRDEEKPLRGARQRESAGSTSSGLRASTPRPRRSQPSWTHAGHSKHKFSSRLTRPRIGDRPALLTTFPSGSGSSDASWMYVFDHAGTGGPSKSSTGGRASETGELLARAAAWSSAQVNRVSGPPGSNVSPSSNETNAIVRGPI